MNPLNQNSPFNGPLTPLKYRQNSTDQTQTETISPKRSYGRYVPIIIGGFALLILPVTIWQLNSQQDIRQRASEPKVAEQKIVAKIGDANITQNDIDGEYAKQQNSNVYIATPSNLKNKILNDLIEKKIIESEALKMSLNVSDQEIENTIELYSQLDPNLNVNRQKAKEITLRTKLAEAISNTVRVNFGFSNNSTPQTLSFFNTLSETAINDNNLTEIKLYSQRSNDINYFENITIPISNNILDADNTNTVFELSENDISTLLTQNDKFFIIHVLEKNEKEFSTFDEYLEQKKLEQATIFEENL